MSEQIWNGFGFGELGYLLIQQDASAVARAREMFDLIEQAYAEDVAMSAVSSLVARGLLEIGAGGVPRPLGPAALLTYAIAEATRWIRVGFFADSEEAADGAVILHAPDATLILQPRQGGAWVMVAKAPGVGDDEAVWALISSFRHSTTPVSVFLEVRDEGDPATMFARSDGVSWSLAVGASARWREERREGVDDDGLRDLLRAMIVGDLAASGSA